MKSKSGGKVPVPEGFGEGINVRVDGSNIEFEEYLPLFQRAAEAVDIRRDYFAEPHPYSNVRDAERYVRLNKDVSGPVHARDGPIAQMGHLLENDREGTAGSYRTIKRSVAKLSQEIIILSLLAQREFRRRFRPTSCRKSASTTTLGRHSPSRVIILSVTLSSERRTR